MFADRLRMAETPCWSLIIYVAAIPHLVMSGAPERRLRPPRLAMRTIAKVYLLHNCRQHSPMPSSSLGPWDLNISGSTHSALYREVKLNGNESLL